MGHAWGPLTREGKEDREEENEERGKEVEEEEGTDEGGLEDHEHDDECNRSIVPRLFGANADAFSLGDPTGA